MNTLSGKKNIITLEKKIKERQSLERDDLMFLYETNLSKEIGFERFDDMGYEDVPRINKLLKKRNLKEDMSIIFECATSEIAFNESEIIPETKVYVGKLFPHIFKTNITHIYATYPENQIRTYHVGIGGKTKEEYVLALKKKKFFITDLAKELLDSPLLKTSSKKEILTLVYLEVRHLGYSSVARTKHIFERVEELGLVCCPPEVGLALRLAFDDFFDVTIGMAPIICRSDRPYVFRLGQEDHPYLGIDKAEPTFKWDASTGFIFCRKLDA